MTASIGSPDLRLRGGAARLAGAFALAAALVFGANAWIGARLPELLQDGEERYVDELARRIAIFPRREAVKLLVVGNSHAFAGLRAPELAAAFGLGRDEVFCLALPGGTAWGQAILLERHRARFPNARAALVAVDMYLFTSHIEWVDRYLSRETAADRWRWARRIPAPDRRLALMAVRPFPLMDCKNAIATAWRASPQRFARRMVMPDPSTTGSAAEMGAKAWPWGIPPPWEGLDTQAYAAYRARWRPAAIVNARARQFTPETAAADVAAGLDDLEELLAAMRGLGLAAELVTLPHHERMRVALAQVGAGRERAYEAQVAAYLARTGRTLHAPRPAFAPDDYVDADHLARGGARKVAAWLADRLRGTPFMRALRP